MRSATLRSQIEAALADRIPSALTPAAKTIREVMPTGIAAVDAVLDGGLPVGAVTEMIGPECSGRTALALSFVAQLTQAERVCAWIDVSNALSPESAAASGIDLKRLLWVRCGVQPLTLQPSKHSSLSTRTAKPWSKIEQALRATDLLLQAGGFSAIVFDLGGIAPEHVSRIPLATWFRYAATADRSRTCVLLLTQHPCSRSSAGLVLRLHQGSPLYPASTVLTGLQRHIEVSRQRFTEVSPKVVPLRKLPHRANSADWQSQTPWAAVR
jgi:recombination protein RecA